MDLPWPWACPTTLRGNQGRLEIAAEGGADRRSAKNADRPMNQSREAHRSAWPLHSPEGAMHSQALPNLHRRGGSQDNPSEAKGLPQSKHGQRLKRADLRVCAPGRTRTCNLRIRSPLLYPLSYRGLWGGYLGRWGRRMAKQGLVLQPHLPFASVVVCAPGTGLMASAPPGPGQHEARLDRGGPHQRDQQPADLGNRQRQQAEPAVQAAVSPFVRSGLVAWARVTARNACASSARVMWRYQPGHLRTS